MCGCVVSVTVKCSVLPPCAVDGRSRNSLYCYYFSLIPDFSAVVFQRHDKLCDGRVKFSQFLGKVCKVLLLQILLHCRQIDLLSFFGVCLPVELGINTQGS